MKPKATDVTDEQLANVMRQAGATEAEIAIILEARPAMMQAAERKNRRPRRGSKRAVEFSPKIDEAGGGTP